MIRGKSIAYKKSILNAGHAIPYQTMSIAPEHVIEDAQNKDIYQEVCNAIIMIFPTILCLIIIYLWDEMFL